MRRRRILFVVKNLQQGGTERQVLQMIRAVDRSRHEVALCTLSPEEHYALEARDVRRYALDASGGAAVAALRAVMNDFRPDLVHSFRDVVNRRVWRALGGLSFRPRWLMSVRGRPVLPLDLAWASLMHRRAFRVAVNSLGIARTLLRWTLIPRRRIAIVPNLVDERAFSPAGASDRRAARAALGLPGEGFVWALPGRLSWVKNQLGLVVAVWLLKRRRAWPPGTTLALAGRSRDSVPSALVPRLVRTLGLEGDVRVLGALAAPEALYAAADAVVLPSFAEGMPNAVLEALLSEVPVVVTPEANRDLLVSQGDNGFVCAGVGPGAIAREMARLMALGADARARMGREGRAGLLRRLSRDAVTLELRQLYDEALGPEPEVARATSETLRSTGSF